MVGQSCGTGAIMKSFSNETRLKNIKRLQGEKFDVIVIGGGITGAGIARDAALRGLKVALIEKGDFASGTSSKSSKLIHGGLRYLETKQFHLVFEALKERKILRQTAPHLAEPLPFLVPIYKSHRVGMWKLGAGLWLYDALSLFSNFKNHVTFLKRGLLEQEPLLEMNGLKGGFLYYDCLTNDAHLTIDIATSSHENGAILANYVEALLFEKEEDRISKVLVRDIFQGDEFYIRAENFINATGPWSDVTRSLALKNAKPLLRPTKGIHVVFPRKLLPTKTAFLMFAMDGRVFFLIPWKEYNILGTTDTDYAGSYDELYATHEEVEYLIQSLKKYFPHHPIEHKDIVSSYAALRPLIAEDEKLTTSVSREHKIIEDVPGLFTIAGGKLTTYRKMAEDIVNLLTEEKCLTHKTKINSNFPQDLSREARVHYAVEHQMAQTLCDFLMRRTGAFLTLPDQGLKLAQEIAPLMAKLLNWGPRRTEEELERYKFEVALSRRFHKQ